MGQESERDDLVETRTTVEAEAARLRENERLQAQHPERIGLRGRESTDAETVGDVDPRDGTGAASSRAAAGEGGDRLTARRNEDISEG